MRPYVVPSPPEGEALGVRGAVGALLLALGLGVAAGLLGAWSLALLAPIFVAVCVVWPAVGVVVLIVACALDRVAIGVGGSNVRPDEVAALALAGALLVRRALMRTPHPQPLALKGVGSHEVGGVELSCSPSPASGRGGRGVRAACIPVLAPLLAYWGANVLSTLVAGGGPARGLRPAAFPHAFFVPCTVLGAVLLLALLRLGGGGQRTRLARRFAGGLGAVAVVVGVGLAVAPSSVTHALWGRAQGLLNFGSGSGYGRVLLYKVALSEWRAHPLLGTGPARFSYRRPAATAPCPPGWPTRTSRGLPT